MLVLYSSGHPQNGASERYDTGYLDADGPGDRSITQYRVQSTTMPEVWQHDVSAIAHAMLPSARMPRMPDIRGLAIVALNISPLLAEKAVVC